MKVLLVGTEGRVGEAILRAFARAGHEVAGLAAGESDATRIERLGGRPVRGEIFSLPSLETALSRGEARADVLVNAAHAVPRKFFFHASDWLGNDRLLREGVNNVVTAALRRRVPLLIQFSSALAYGDHGGAWVDESAPLRPPQVVRAAADMEASLRSAAKIKGLRAVVLRGGIPCGRRLWYLGEILSLLERGRLPAPRSGGAFMNFIHPEDLARAAVLAAERAPIGAAFNVTDGEPIQLRALLAIAAEALGVRPPRGLPDLLLRLAVPRPIREVLSASARVSIDRAREVLGWAPVHPPVRARIPDLVRAWQEDRERGRVPAFEDP